MSREVRGLVIASALGALVACDGAQVALFGSPTQIQGVPGATPSPTPTPAPSIAPTPDPCAIKAVRVSFYGGVGAQVPSLEVGQTRQLDATPINDLGPVADGCNLTRSVAWSVATPQTCAVVGVGFNPFLRGLKVGSCSLTATVERVVSDLWTVDIR